MNTATLLKVIDVRFNGTRKTIAAIPSDRLDFRPMPDMMSARELALHLVGNYTFLGAGLGDGKWSPETFRVDGEFPTTEAVVARFGELYRASRERIAGVADEVFQQRVSPFGVEQKVSSLIQGIAEHEVQHRGQLQVYLHLMGVKPPSVYGD